MHEITANKTAKSFTPFTLHCNITTRETADNIVKLLMPFVYSSGQTKWNEGLPKPNKEQRQWAEDVCNIIEKNKRG